MICALLEHQEAMLLSESSRTSEMKSLNRDWIIQCRKEDMNQTAQAFIANQKQKNWKST